MGLELTLQALPPDLPLLEAARARPLEWQAIQFLPSWLQKLAAGKPLRRIEDEVDALLVRTCEELLQRDPAICQRRVEVERRWDILVLLLSLGLPAAAREPTEAARVAVRGESELAAGLVATQGSPIRWTAPSAVPALSRLLLTFNVPRAVAAFRQSAPEHDDVYKLRPHNLERSLSDCLADVHELTALYQAAEERGYGLLVVLD